MMTLTPALFLLWLLYLPLNAFPLNFNNNACSNLELYRISSFTEKCYENQDVLSDVLSMNKRHGYKTETFSVTTSDGYILTLFKILPTSKVKKENVIFMQHGIITNSGPWVDIGNRSLAFTLADEGYEVWLGNVRGSTYSNKHRNLTVSDPDYWNFNLDTIAENDMAVQLNFVATQSGKKIHYIGHSMGTTLILMLTSTFTEEVNNWLQSITLLAPVAYLNNVPAIEMVKLPGLVLFFLDIIFQDLLSSLRMTGLFYQESTIHNVLTTACRLVPELCYDFINILSGRTTQFESDDLLLYYSYWPSGVSIYQLKQYLQIANSKRFQKFDYGSSLNLKFYGTENPPVYNLTNIMVPTALLYGENDSLYNQNNLEKLFNEIGSSIKYKYAISDQDDSQSFSHVDFLYSKFITKYLYTRLFDVLKKFEE